MYMYIHVHVHVHNSYMLCPGICGIYKPKGPGL